MSLLRVAASAVLTVFLTACASGGPRRDAATAPPRLDGAAILGRACTTCHDLGGLRAYAAYWGEAEWRSMVETMLTYGARLESEEVEVLGRYLAMHYGTGVEGGG